MTTVRIGAGAAASIDPFEAGLEVLEAGMDYLVLEHLSEHSITRAQRRKRSGGAGFAAFFEERLREFLSVAAAQGTDIVTNAGAADPIGAGRIAAEVASEADLDVTITVLTGDECVDVIKEHQDEHSLAVEDIISANAYLGVSELLGALEQPTGDADIHVVISGRVADPSLAVAPLAYEFDWHLDDWDRIGQATVLGHLLECSAQSTGGYFAEPVSKPVEDPHNLGFPYLEVEADGTATITKPNGTGGRIDDHVLREQLYYEVHDPTAYVTPDVTADFTTVRFEQRDTDRVRVAGGSGTEAPDQLKVTVGAADGYRTQCFIPYGGPNAVPRAELAAEIVRDRLTEIHEMDLEETVDLRTDFIGLDALYGSESPPIEGSHELQLRVAAQAPKREQVELVFREALQLWHLGPAGSGGVFPYEVDEAVRETIALDSLLVPRDRILPNVSYSQFGRVEA